MRTSTLTIAAMKRTVLLAAMLLSAAAFGHDPLKHEHARQHVGEHGNEHRNDGHHSRRSHRGTAAEQAANDTDARALVTLFRETGDDRHLDRAWASLKPVLGSADVEPETLITASFVAQSRHEFSDALNLINRSLAIDDNNDEAWLLSASIHLVQGDTEAAARACRQLRGISPVVQLTCSARVALANGQHEAAFVRLKGLLKLSDDRRLPLNVRAWSYGVAGDLAVAADELQQAVELYRRSLGLAERTQVRAALVDVLLRESRLDDAWRALNDGAPALPLLIRRLIVAKRLGRIDEFDAVMAKVHNEFNDWIANEDWLHAREMARFYVDVVNRPGLARRLALINVGLQQEPEDLRLEVRTRPAEI